MRALACILCLLPAAVFAGDGSGPVPQAGSSRVTVSWSGFPLSEEDFEKLSASPVEEWVALLHRRPLTWRWNPVVVLLEPDDEIRELLRRLPETVALPLDRFYVYGVGLERFTGKWRAIYETIDPAVIFFDAMGRKVSVLQGRITGAGLATEVRKTWWRSYGLPIREYVRSARRLLDLEAKGDSLPGAWSELRRISAMKHPPLRNMHGEAAGYIMHWAMPGFADLPGGEGDPETRVAALARQAGRKRRPAIVLLPAAGDPEGTFELYGSLFARYSEPLGVAIMPFDLFRAEPAERTAGVAVFDAEGVKVGQLAGEDARMALLRDLVEEAWKRSFELELKVFRMEMRAVLRRRDVGVSEEEFEEAHRKLLEKCVVKPQESKREVR